MCLSLIYFTNREKNLFRCFKLLTLCITVTFAPKSANILPTKGIGARPENSNTFNPFKGMFIRENKILSSDLYVIYMIFNQANAISELVH